MSANSGYDFDSNSEATPPTTQLADSRSPTRSVPFRSGALSSRVLELRPPEDRGSLAQRLGSLRWLQIKDSNGKTRCLPEFRGSPASVKRQSVLQLTGKTLPKFRD